ncbi:IclR family transcriptional regulator [Saccharopolyspora sp. K220]|uniref:IclR family transcriptional regulator n=1 Tax=Saccharopolyspora soli TaxID=2926618 RepID=UPI001F56E270|nr:IclR family transcriptional regulator [Saccharopolyspora soli]MCI2417408.1 IclR family transcriptional regulator [Saccharopolyspora soli]
MRNESASNDRTSAATSVDKALALVLLINEVQQIRVSEAAEALGVARSTAHRLLTQLRARDFVVQDGQRVYRPGPALEQLNSTPVRRLDLRRELHDHLLSCSRQVSETVHLMVLEGNGVRFVDGVEGPHALRVGLRTGVILPAHCTAGGKALLASLSLDALKALYPRGLPRTNGNAVTTVAALSRQLATARRRGYATNIEESERGITAVGAPITDARHRTVGAMAIAVPTARCPRSRIGELVEELLRASSAASKAL